jgi:hypothetical protein
LAAAALLLLPVGEATAAIVPLKTTEEMTRQADLVVTGCVRGMSSRWNEEHTNIFTFVEVRVAEVLKGTHDGETLTVKVYGGIVGDTTIGVSNMPRFAVDERVLLFLQGVDRDPGTGKPGSYQTCNLDQGKLSVLIDKAGNEVLFWPSALRYPGPPKEGVAAAYGGSPQPLSQLIQEIRNWVASEKRGQAGTGVENTQKGGERDED